MADMEKIKDKVGDIIDKVSTKAKEIKDSEETKEFIDKTKKTAVKVGNKAVDVAINVGVKAADLAEDLATRGQKAMHEVKEKNDAKKDGYYDGEFLYEEFAEEECCPTESEVNCNCAPECDCETDSTTEE